MDMQIMLSAKIRHLSDVSEFDSAEDIINLLDIAFVEAATNSDSPQTAAVDVGLLPEERRRIMVESAVKDSLETQAGFTLYFQPIYSVSAKKFTCAEVLLRFNHETMGKISPAEFIPVAEKLGLIFAIDQMVVEKACRFIKKIRSCLMMISIISTSICRRPNLSIRNCPASLQISLRPRGRSRKNCV